MLTPSANFNALREAAGNHITQKVVVETGNFALSMKGAQAAASSTFSADWPASGVIDGDRTHINAGAPSAAENGDGLSVWQSNGVADGSGNINESIELDFGKEVRVNRVTLIFWPDNTKNGNLGSIGFKDFLFEIASAGSGFGGGGFGSGAFGAAYTAWSGLVDKCAEIGKAATTIVAGQVTGNVNDMVVFEDPTPQTIQNLRISISKLQAASVRARLVAIEITLAVDISAFVTSMQRTRRKDYHLERRVASQVSITLRNFDGRFNDLYTPTAAEVVSGFFNPYIRPCLPIRVYGGFSGVYSQMFTGFIDYWEPDDATRLCKIQASDYLKFLQKPKLSTPLHTGLPIEGLVELTANYLNFPSNMMLLDSSTITPSFFMPKNESAISIINKLQDATGNSEVYLDEFGRLNYRSYLTVISHIFFQTGAGDFAAGTNINNTDFTSQPGYLVLSNVAGVYAKEGNWYSALSPVLTGKVEFTDFMGAAETGAATSIDFFLRVTNDGGATFTPWREIINGDRISKLNEWYGQIQLWARFRTSDTTVTPRLINFTVNYRSRGGSSMISLTPDWTSKDITTLLGLKRRLTDQVGGTNYMVTKSIVKSKPTFLSSGAVDAWIGTENGNPISGTNPLFVPIGDTVINVDFGNTQYGVPQTVVMTLGSAVATATLTSDPSAPILTITATVAGTITLLKVTGQPFVQNGTVQAITLADPIIAADFGTYIDELDNDYIDNVRLAQDIADNVIDMFGKGPLDWIPQGAEMRFTPNAQLNDRVTIQSRFSSVNTDYVALGLVDEISLSGDSHDFTGKTTAELVKIGTTGFAATTPAHFGSAGQFYYDNFRFGGSYQL